MRQLAGCTGFFLAFACIPPSPDGRDGDVSDNGLPSWMNMNMLDADNLLATLAAPAVQRGKQLDENAATGFSRSAVRGQDDACCGPGERRPCVRRLARRPGAAQGGVAGEHADASFAFGKAD